MSLRKESRRLSRAFGALLMTLAPAAAAQACLDSSAPAEGATDAAPDDHAASVDAPVEADADSGAGDGNLRVDDPCTLITETLEAGPDGPADADLACRYTLPCGIPDSGGFILRGCDFFLNETDPDASDGSLGCAIPEVYGCSNGVYTPPANGSLTFECIDCFGGGGRRPVGLRGPRAPRANDAVGDYFARMAHDEAASVHAFVRMQAELSHLGAPAELVSAAERSAHDERRHARMMERRARRSGARVASARLRGQSRSRRSLEAVARENAVEGCVNETFGALLLRFQAARATDPALRRLFERVAADETRHAALSWEVARWAEDRLDPRARARVVAARYRAVYTLREKLTARRATSSASPRSVVGQPDRDEALALLDGMIATLGLA